MQGGRAARAGRGIHAHVHAPPPHRAAASVKAHAMHKLPRPGQHACLGKLQGACELGARAALRGQWSRCRPGDTLCRTMGSWGMLAQDASFSKRLRPGGREAAAGALWPGIAQCLQPAHQLFEVVRNMAVQLKLVKRCGAVLQPNRGVAYSASCMHAAQDGSSPALQPLANLSDRVFPAYLVDPQHFGRAGSTTAQI